MSSTTTESWNPNALILNWLGQVKSMHTLPSSKRRQTSASHGFSLVEVVIAVGIMAVGIVAVLGLLPHGLAMTKKTSDLTYQTRIFQHLLSEYQSMSWSALEAGTSGGGAAQQRLFDYQGIELTSASTNQQQQFISYVASIEISPNPVELPHTNGQPKGNEHLRRLVVRIAATPDVGFDFEQASPRSFSTYSAYLARTF